MPLYRRARWLLIVAAVLSPSLLSAATAAEAARERLLDLLVGVEVAPVVVIAEARAVQSRATGDPALRSIAASVECRGLLRQSDMAAAAAACERALALTGDADPLARFAAERMAGALAAERGRPLAALTRLVEAHAAAVRSGNPLAIAAALAGIGSAAQLAGANGDAVDFYVRAQSAAPRAGAYSLRSQIANNLGVLLLESGDASAAVGQFMAAIDAARLAPIPYDAVAARHGLALAEIEQGRAAEAVPRLRALVAANTAGQMPAQAAEAQLYLARAEFLLGRHAEAEAAARAAAAALREVRPVRAYPALALLVDVLVAAGRLDDAGRLGDQLLEVIPEDARGHVQLLEARERLFAARGRYADAYRAAVEVRRVRGAQAMARATRSLAFLQARTAAEERAAALAQSRAGQERARAEAQRERMVRNLALVVLAATLAAGLALWRAERARRQLATEIERRRGADALGQLTAGVAHDFNNLMTIVQQSMGLLRREPAIAASGSSLELISEAEGAARLGGTITEQLLAFGRRQPLRPATFAVAPFLEARRLLLSRALGPSMRLLVELHDADARVHVDPAQLTAALVHLLTNARDAMQERGDVTLRLETTTSGPREPRWPDLPPGRYAMVSIVDRGSGMSPELARKAVLPFFTTKNVDGGAGLGLSSALGFATQSKGALHIDSRPGVGTTVALVLPTA